MLHPPWFAWFGLLVRQGVHDPPCSRVAGTWSGGEHLEERKGSYLVAVHCAFKQRIVKYFEVYSEVYSSLFPCQLRRKGFGNFGGPKICLGWCARLDGRAPPESEPLDCCGSQPFRSQSANACAPAHGPGRGVVHRGGQQAAVVGGPAKVHRRHGEEDGAGELRGCPQPLGIKWGGPPQVKSPAQTAGDF